MFWGDEQFAFFETVLFQTLGQPVEVLDVGLLSGGDINTAAKVFTAEGPFFVKWNHATDLPDLFGVEARSLNLLRQTGAVCVPRVLGHGVHLDKAYLVLEYVDSADRPATTYWDQLAQQVAELHAHTQPQFGLSFDTYIGTLPQANTPTERGAEFFFTHRLLPQAGRALYSGLLSRALYDRLLRLHEQLPGLLPNERPALLHGDLWTGNVMVSEAGGPALIDPAVYYGFREAELAFTKLFGGFDTRFYEAYHEVFPLENGFAERIPIYNLYPLLVHVNLFGTGYVSGVEKILNRF